MLAQNSGQSVIAVLTKLYAAHTEGNSSAGVNIEGKDSDALINATDLKILDHYTTKMWALNHAVEAALTVLRIDQIIMSKQAGGKPQ